MWKEGKTIGEISESLGINKSTLHPWLSNQPRSPAHATRSRERWEAAMRVRSATRKASRMATESKFSKAVSGQDLTRARKSQIAEAAILFRLVLHGFNVYGSVFDGDRTDWLAIVEKDGTRKRIQVKWMSRAKWGEPHMHLKCKERGTMRRYRDDEFDAMVGYDLFTDTAYVYTPAEISKNVGLKAASANAAERWDKLLVPV